MKPSFLDATEQAALVRQGAIGPAELVEQSIRAIEAQDPALGALVDTRFARARAEAAGPLPDGPFTGVPMLVRTPSCTARATATSTACASCATGPGARRPTPS